MGSSFDRKGAVDVAKLAQQARRYDDMGEAMKIVAKMGGEMSLEETILVSVAYGKMIQSRRDSWKVLSTILVKEHSLGWENAKRTIDYMGKLGNEIAHICTEMLPIVDRHIIPSYQPEDAHPVIGIRNLHLLKMKGDFNRFLGELKSSGSTERKEALDEAFNSYEAALTIARVQIRPSHHTRLLLALNHALLFNEIYASITRAIQFAKLAYDEAFPERNGMDEISKEAMQLLRNQIIQWESENVPE